MRILTNIVSARTVFFAVSVVVSLMGQNRDGYGLTLAESNPAVHLSTEDASENEFLFSIDGQKYSQADLRLYVLTIMQDREYEERKTAKYINSMILDLLGFEYVSSMHPEILQSLSLQTSIDEFQSKLLFPAYYKAITDNVDVPIKEIAASIPINEKKYEISVIMAPDRGKIAEAEDALGKGERFREVAIRFSTGFSSERGGRIGLIEESAQSLFTGEEFQKIKAVSPGTCSQPFETRIGWAIVYLHKIWQPEELRMEEAKRTYSSRKLEIQGEQFRKSVESLARKNRIETDRSTLDEYLSKTSAGEPLTTEFLSRPVAWVEGDPIYVGQIEKIGLFHNPGDLYTHLNKTIERKMIAREARRLGLDHNPGFRQSVDLYRKRMITRMFIEREMRTVSTVDEATMKDYYEANKEKFASEERRDLSAIEVDSKEYAEKAFSLLKNGATFEEVAGRFNQQEEARDRKGRLGIVRSSQIVGEISDVVFSMKKGEYSRPVGVTSNDGRSFWVIVKVEEVFPGTPIPYEEIDRRLLQDKIVARRMDEFHGSFLDNVMGKHEVQIFWGRESHSSMGGQG